jgi:hypothetical protein
VACPPPGEALAGALVLDVDDGQPLQLGDGVAGEVTAPQREISCPEWSGRGRAPLSGAGPHHAGSCRLVRAGGCRAFPCPLRDRPDDVGGGRMCSRESYLGIRYHVMVIYISIFLAEGVGFAFFGY